MSINFNDLPREIKYKVFGINRRDAQRRSILMTHLSQIKNYRPKYWDTYQRMARHAWEDNSIEWFDYVQGDDGSILCFMYFLKDGDMFEPWSTYLTHHPIHV